MIRLLNARIRAFHAGIRCTFPAPIDASATMPSQEPYRLTEAIRRVLSELRKLDQYERRAAARRDRALLDISDRIESRDNL
jgi:hypothetical protein